MMHAGRYRVGHISDFAERQGRVLKCGELEIALFLLSDGTVRAVENRCPHKGGKLSEGIVCGQHVYCPLHDWKIDLRDGCVQAPDDGRVATFETEVDGGDIYIRFGGAQDMVS